MKKRFSIIAALSLLFAAFMFTGCDEIANEFECYDTWYEYTYDYEVSGKTVELSCYLVYQRDGVTTTKIKQNVDFVDGLNLVIVPGAKGDTEVFNAIADGFADNGSYLYKSYPEGESVGDFAIEMNKSTWVLIWQDLKSKENFDERGTMPPDILTHKTTKNLATDGINWKGILASVLIGALS